MRKRIVGVIFCLLAILDVFIISMVKSSTDAMELKYEPIEHQNEASETAGEIMDELVTHTEVIHVDDTGITYDEAQMLMKIAVAEAEIDGIEGQAMVMAVVLNRVNDSRFPDTIEGVIFQEYNGTYQFSPIGDGRYYKAEPNIDSHLALAEIEKGNYYWVDALYFDNAKDSWQKRNCDNLYTVGHHSFYRN